MQVILDCHARKQELDTELADLQRDVTLPHHPQALLLWRQFHEHGIMPRAGGYLDQPQWWQDDMIYLNLLNELAGLPHEETRANKRLAELALNGRTG